MSSKSIHVATNGRISSFLWLNNPSTKTLRFFPCLGYCEQCCYDYGGTVIILSQCFGYIPGSEISGSYGSAVFNFLSSSILFFIVAEPIYSPTNRAHGYLFSTSSPASVPSCLFYDGHSNRHQVISHCDLNLHFPDDQCCRASFHVLVGLSTVSLKTQLETLTTSVCHVNSERTLLHFPLPIF